MDIPRHLHAIKFPRILIAKRTTNFQIPFVRWLEIRILFDTPAVAEEEGDDAEEHQENHAENQQGKRQTYLEVSCHSKRPRGCHSLFAHVVVF